MPNVGQRSGRRSRSRDKATIKSQKAGIQHSAIAESNTRNADVINAVGFGGAALAWFNQVNESHLDLQTGANYVTGTMGATKVLRMIMQSAVLGLGAYPPRLACQ